MKEFKDRNLQKASFVNEDLSSSHFSNCDLRGADFTGANLSGAEFSNIKTGVTPLNTYLVFFAAIIVSALSGYIAMVAGTTAQRMLTSDDIYMRISGMITLVIAIGTLIVYYWKGGTSVFRMFLIPALIIAAIIGTTAYFTGLGTGKGMLYLGIVLILLVLMFIVGTVARATAGMLSSVLFLIVALSGGLFSRTVGGGFGTVIMAISCALISKKALRGAPGFENLRKFAFYITSKFGTSFRQCDMRNTDFSQLKTIHNADFSNTDTTSVQWGDCRKINCIDSKQENRPILERVAESSNVL